MATHTDELATLRRAESVLLKGFDYLEFYVGNAYQAAHFYRNLYGFKPIAFAGLETGVRDRASIVLQQNDIRLVLTTALTPDHPITRHVSLHGDDVRDIAFTVEESRCLEGVADLGAEFHWEPEARPTEQTAGQRQP